MQPEEPGPQLPPAFAASTGWQAMVCVGIVTVILGLIISLHPSGSLNVIAVLIGVLLVISGIFHLVRVFDRSEPHRVWLGIAGLLLVVIGVILIRHLNLTVALVGLVIGVTWMVQGLASLVTAFSGGTGERRGWCRCGGRRRTGHRSRLGRSPRATLPPDTRIPPGPIEDRRTELKRL